MQYCTHSSNLYMLGIIQDTTNQHAQMLTDTTSRDQQPACNQALRVQPGIKGRRTGHLRCASMERVPPPACSGVPGSCSCGAGCSLASLMSRAACPKVKGGTKNRACSTCRYASAGLSRMHSYAEAERRAELGNSTPAVFAGLLNSGTSSACPLLCTQHGHADKNQSVLETERRTFSFRLKLLHGTSITAD